MSHTPLIALTADRPPELQDRGAPQTINQTNLYGSAAKWFRDTGVPNAETIADAGHLGRQAVASALEVPAGPVHVNIPLREPLVPDEAAGLSNAPLRVRLVPDEAGLRSRPVPPESEIRRIAELVNGRPVAIVAGESASPGLAAAVFDLARTSRAVVVADPQSAARFDGTANPALITTADLILETGLTPAFEPEVVIHVGAIHTSQPVNRWLERLDAHVVHVHDGQWSDPLGIASTVVAADPAATLEQLAKIVEAGPHEFAESWRLTDDLALGAAAEALATAGVSEAAVAHTMLAAVPAGSTVFAGSSMPIRLIDSYGRRRSLPASVIANRGANGIDGAISTALGIAAAGPGHTYALVGDLAALADVGSLATASRLDIPLTIVVINNDGGGIFEYLPQADPDRIAPETYRELIATPHGQEIAPIAEAFGVTSEVIADLGSLGEALSRTPAGPRVVEVHTERSAGPPDRDRIVALVAEAIAS